MEKNSEKFYLVAIMLFSTMLASLGQLLFKLGLSGGGAVLLGYVLSGVVAYGISTIAYLYTLSRSHLSWAYGFVGLSYIFATALAFFVLGESLGMLRIVGVIAIMVGTFLIGSGQHK